jgi:spermidine synthase
MKHRKAGTSPVNSKRRSATRSSSELLLAACLVFCSGASALVFQMAWMRELRLIFGGTTAATAAVLAIFMAGLGAGSAILGRRADRVANPMRMYGLLEAAIALSTAVTPLLIGLASALYLRMGGQESLGLWGATTVRIALAAAVIALPTFLMGGTLPALVRAVTPSSDANRRALALLYGSNTLGAVLGAAATTFFALDQFGTRATLWSGCALGFTVGIIAIRWSRSLRAIPEVSRAALDSQSANQPASAKATIDVVQVAGHPTLIYAIAAILGFTFFALELVWYRMLGPILGGTAFTFGLILCVALFGIGVGGLAYQFVFRRREPTWNALAVTCGCEALAIVVPLALGDRLAFRAAWSTLHARDFSSLVISWTTITAIVILPAALVSGLQFPLLTALLGHGRQTVSKHLGMTYAWNTLGAIAGSLVAGFGAMPALSAPGLWRAIAVVLGALSVVVLAAAPARSRRAVVVVGALLLATAASLWTEGPTAAWRHSGIGAGRALVPPPNEPNRLRQWANEKEHVTIWEADGIECSVALHGQDGIAFVVNGKSDGNALADAPTQIGVAILGAVLHPDPRTGLVIGLGTGESAGWLAEMRGMEHVDVVELEPAIDEMARRASDLNWNVLQHPRVRRLYNDGREFVFATDKHYDVIISEPSNPYRAGIAALYTAEFYRAVRERLNPGGVFVQFLQAYEVDEQTVDTVLATVRSAFPHVEVWQTLGADLQLACSDRPIKHSVEELRGRITSPRVKEALAKAWKVEDVEGFLGHFVGNSQWADLVARSPHVPLNTDDRTILEYSFAKTVGRDTPFSVEETRDRLRADGHHRPELGDEVVDWDLVELRRQTFNLILGGQLSIALLPNPDDRRLVEAFDRYRNNDFAGAIELWPADSQTPADATQRLVLARTYAELGRPECLEVATSIEPQFPTDADAVRAIYYWRVGDAAQAAAALESFFTRLADDPWVVPVVSESAFSRAVDAATADRDAAERLYRLLSKPFASMRFEYLRQLARLRIAEQLGPQEVIEALAELEPHVTWTAEVLEPRAKAYAALNHPLAEQAKRDWDWFQQHRQSSTAR